MDNIRIVLIMLVDIFIFIDVFFLINMVVGVVSECVLVV